MVSYPCLPPLSPPDVSVSILHHLASAHTHLSTNTPLFLACRSASTGAAASALQLIIAGADVNSKNFGQNTDISHSETPLHAAAEACAPSRSRPAAGVADAAPCENAADSGAVLELNEVREPFGIY